MTASLKEQEALRLSDLAFEESLLQEDIRQRKREVAQAETHAAIISSVASAWTRARGDCLRQATAATIIHKVLG